MKLPDTALHITKPEINLLPMKQYEGPIHLIRTPEEADRAAEKLKAESLLGFDTETRPAFRVGESYRPSLLQLASEKEVFLFQIQKTGLTKGLCDILASPEIIKTGVSIRDDVSELRKITNFEPAGFIELATCAKKARIKNLGLRGMAALLLGFRISKREQVSNWAKSELTDSQITYAATDAWLGREIYLHMDQLGLILS
ncbi:MAG: 3'-5' exonuclease domain-containing protein 2 [Kiritimatiellales bacterium]|nr:3'-5' exonuclease domain-containing protein 2 [Kiritimatiellota bacterium]MBL7012357.1 3'-5' exonuclease domain-containing protein 2 [Kiritimatiellales bacterium]